MTHRILAILDEPQTAPSCLAAAGAAASCLSDIGVEVAQFSFDAAGARHPALVAAGELEMPDAHPDLQQIYRTWINGHPEYRGLVEWMAHPPQDEESAAAAAQYFQTLVLAYPLDLPSADILHAVLFRMARPFILVPSLWAPHDNHAFGRHVMIAWNGSGGCQRAVHGALPWLRSASRISILMVDSGRVAHEIELILRENGLRYEVHQAHALGCDRAERILEEAYGIGADLIVLGAYTSGGDKSWNQGGTTRHMFSEGALPLLMAH